MIRKLESIVLLFCFFVFGQAASAQEQDMSKPDKNTLLWRVSGNGLVKPSYIFGTLHVICKEEAEKIITPTLKQALQSCTEVLFEINSKNTAALIIASMKGSKMRNDTTLKQLVNKRELKTIMDYFTQQKTAIPLDKVQTLSPLMLQSEVYKSFITCASKTSVEAELTELADSCQIKIDGISSVQEQTSFGDSVSYREQAKTLMQTMADVKNPSKNVFYKIKELYVAQEMIALNNSLNPDNPGKFSRIFLETRNKLWAPRLVEKMKTEQVFLAVGCAHLFGRTGLITLLRKQGYMVEGVPNTQILIHH